MNIDDLSIPPEDHPLRDCIADHLPAWVDKISGLIISRNDYKQLMGLMERYNECQDYIETFSSDGNMIFGYQTEQEELIKEMLVIYEKYKPVNNG